MAPFLPLYEVAMSISVKTYWWSKCQFPMSGVYTVFLGPDRTSFRSTSMSDVLGSQYFVGLATEGRFVRNLSDANQCILVNFCELLRHYHRRKPDLKWVTRQNLMLDRGDPLGL